MDTPLWGFDRGGKVGGAEYRPHNAGASVKAGAKGPIHMVSAWSSAQRLVLGQRQVDDKSNEIIAIPELLDLLTLEGAIVTIDAMGCQYKIANLIVAKKADYLFGLKGNQGRPRAWWHGRREAPDCRRG